MDPQSSMNRVPIQRSFSELSQRVTGIKRKKVVTDRSRHSYTAFIFTGNDDVETTLSLTCNIVACLESECSNLISECSRRKRRSTVPQSQQYTTTVTKVFRK